MKKVKTIKPAKAVKKAAVNPFKVEEMPEEIKVSFRPEVRNTNGIAEALVNLSNVINASGLSAGRKQIIKNQIKQIAKRAK